MSAEMLSAVRLADCRSTQQASGRQDSDGTSFARALGEAVASSDDTGTDASAASSGSASAAAGKGTGRADGVGSAVRSSRQDADACGGDHTESDGDTADGDATQKTDVVSAGALLLLAAMLPGAAVTLVQTAGSASSRTDGSTAVAKAAATVTKDCSTVALSAAGFSPAGGAQSAAPVKTAPGDKIMPESIPAAAGAQPAILPSTGGVLSASSDKTVSENTIVPDSAPAVAAGTQSAGGVAAGKSAAMDFAVINSADAGEGRLVFSAVPAAALRAAKPVAAQSAAAEDSAVTVAPSAHPAVSGIGSAGKMVPSAVPADAHRAGTGDDKADESAASGQTFRPDAAVGAASSLAGRAETAAVSAAGTEKTGLTSQVARQIAAALQDNEAAAHTQLRVHLSPADLGGINLRFATENGRVTLQITADSSRTGTLLAAHLDDLSRSLAQSGVTMDRTEVFCQTGTGGQSGFGSWQGGSPPGSQSGSLSGFSSQTGPGQGDGRQPGDGAASGTRLTAAEPGGPEPSPARVSSDGMSIFA